MLLCHFLVLCFGEDTSGAACGREIFVGDRSAEDVLVCYAVGAVDAESAVFTSIKDLPLGENRFLSVD